MRRVKGLIGFKGLVLVLVLAGVTSLAFQSRPAEAHCDSVSGPVVGAAKLALTKGDVKLVLPYVQPDAEKELTAAFEQAVKVRKQGGAAQLLAETYFYETAVRLHRVGEGATYTGLKYDTDFGAALEAADQALETGSAKAVNKVLLDAVNEGVAAKFKAVQDARAKAEKLGTVEAHRERVEAELMFEKYVLELRNAATGQTAHGEGEVATAAHGAGE
jgi:hypothetical protein